MIPIRFFNMEQYGCSTVKLHREGICEVCDGCRLFYWPSSWKRFKSLRINCLWQKCPFVVYGDYALFLSVTTTPCPSLWRLRPVPLCGDYTLFLSVATTPCSSLWRLHPVPLCDDYTLFCFLIHHPYKAGETLVCVGAQGIQRISLSWCNKSLGYIEFAQEYHATGSHQIATKKQVNTNSHQMVFKLVMI